MLKAYVLKRKLGQNDRLFAVDSASISKSYRRIRNRLADNLGDMSVKTIRLYDFRHFEATMEYHRNKRLASRQETSRTQRFEDNFAVYATDRN